MSAQPTQALQDDALQMLALLKEVLDTDDKAAAELKSMGIEPPARGYDLTERIRALVAKHTGSAT